jgi:hypothetical protein
MKGEGEMAHKTLSPAAVTWYVEVVNGDYCPGCASKLILRGMGSKRSGGDLQIGVYCTKCHRRWSEVYALVSIKS